MWVAGLGKSIGSGPRNETGMVMAEAARRIALAEQPLYREAPNNIEAEQALLGAILVNNDAYYRVSDFLEAGAFLRAAAPADLRGRGRADPHGQGRDPDHHEDLPAGR